MTPEQLKSSEELGKLQVKLRIITIGIAQCLKRDLYGGPPRADTILAVMEIAQETLLPAACQVLDAERKHDALCDEALPLKRYGRKRVQQMPRPAQKEDPAPTTRKARSRKALAELQMSSPRKKRR